MFTQIEPARLRRSQKQRDVCSAYSMGIEQGRLWKAIASLSSRTKSSDASGMGTSRFAVGGTTPSRKEKIAAATCKGPAAANGFPIDSLDRIDRNVSRLAIRAPQPKFVLPRDQSPDAQDPRRKPNRCLPESIPRSQGLPGCSQTIRCRARLCR